MIKVAFFGLEDWEKEYIKQLEEFKKLDMDKEFLGEFIDADHMPKETDYEAISIFVDSTIDKKVLDKMPELKFIDARSTGFDHIDIEECRKRGIEVSYSPSYGQRTVAEFTFALMLALTRKVYEGFNRIRETGNFSVEGLRGIDLQDKTLGVLGTGRIGRNVIQIAKGFDMNVLAFDAYPNKEAADELGFEYADLKTVLAGSDIVTLHLPHTDETHHLINKDTIYDIKKGAFLINTSRGGIIQTEALVKALKDEHLAGAGIDVMEEEGSIRDELEFLLDENSKSESMKTVLANHLLVDMPNVVITPHNAFNTWGALERILETSVDNLEAFMGGEHINIVPKQ
ncbi:MAG: NAD(P)-dependent oxidoreductase [Candidatus Spechtbacterales bacterium]|nr:NAD(P)-dependent oxidoreductase [Candidatus Spechtbacterales bacterium]